MTSKYLASALFVLGLFSAGVVSAQSVDPAFQKARQERNAAMRTGDMDAFNKYTTDNFLVVDPTGRVENKQERGARVAAAKNNPPPAGGGGQPQLLDEKIDVYGNSVVLNWHAPGPQAREMHFTEVWVKQDGTWKCATAHISMDPAKAQ